MTNGDKIRKGTDEELVDFLFRGDNVIAAPPGRKCLSECRFDNCRDCWLDYFGEECDEAKPAPDLVPNCVSCSHRKDEVIDEFPVSKCPFGGTILQPWATCCDQYAMGGGAGA